MNMGSTTIRGWVKPSEGAKYASVSLKTFRGWLKNGLRHVRLDNGRILISYDWIDEYLLKFEAKDKEFEAMADELIQGLE